MEAVCTSHDLCMQIAALGAGTVAEVSSYVTQMRVGGIAPKVEPMVSQGTMARGDGPTPAPAGAGLAGAAVASDAAHPRYRFGGGPGGVAAAGNGLTDGQYQALSRLA